MALVFRSSRLPTVQSCDNMVAMPAQKDSLADRLARYREIKITVTGRKSGRKIANPVWFVFEDSTLYLVPVQGSDTQWYKNVLSNPKMRIEARGENADVKAATITDHTDVARIVEKFREKYGAGDVKKYYSKFDAAVRVEIR